MNKYGTLLLVILLTGCDNSTVNSPLVGSWLTQSCEQIPDGNGGLSNVWGQSTYTFDANGQIHLATNLYSDSNCITSSNANNLDPSIIVASYVDNGSVTTPQGIQGNAITISFTSAPPPIVTTDGFYSITNNQLCLSIAFHFKSIGFSITAFNDSDIDFNNCLVSTNAP